MLKPLCCLTWQQTKMPTRNTHDASGSRPHSGASRRRGSPRCKAARQCRTARLLCLDGRERCENEHQMPPCMRLASWTSGDSHRSSRSSSACRKSRGQRCRRASRSAQCSVADLGGWVLRVQVGWNVATSEVGRIGRQGKCAGGALGPCRLPDEHC